MASEDKFSCYLIGVNRLLQECGDALLKKGHEIRGVITASDALLDWADDRDIPTFDPKSDYQSELASEPFDYFFSITWFSIIPEPILAMPQKMAINFHDGPLPRYAGLNAPAWALMHGEKNYGITWHVMTAGVDTGDILKQEHFALDARETSLSLNATCFEKALASFDVLIDELSQSRLVRQVQDQGERSYFGKHLRPSAAGALDWNQPAIGNQRRIEHINPFSSLSLHGFENGLAFNGIQVSFYRMNIQDFIFQFCCCGSRWITIRHFEFANF